MKNTETVLDARKEFGPEVNAEKIKYMLIFRQQTAKYHFYVKAPNIAFKIWLS